MDVVALIPARGGSKGIPGKNLAPVAGKPLLAWTIEAARAAQTPTRVVVSTDSGEIAQVARRLGAEVLERPGELARDETPMIDVVRHALAALPCDVLVLLQPTTPLRRAEDVDAAVRLLVDSEVDCVVSVVPVPHRYLPESLMALGDTGTLAPLDASATALRQEKRTLYARNGPAVLVRRASAGGAGLYDGDCRAYVMPAERSLDVDDAHDLRLADLLLAAQG